jgi:hypothetical protein
MSELDEIKIPMEPTDPIHQHGQIMFALGQIIATQKGIMARQDITNGKVLKNTNDIDTIRNWQSNADGQERGISRTWATLFAVGGLIVGAAAVYVAVHFH